MYAKLVVPIAALTIAILGSGSIVLYQQTDALRQQNIQNESTNTERSENEEIDIQAEIDAILADESIDISDWPIFTNTAYGWSIKVHPEAEWASNSMLHTEETAPGPTYRVDRSYAIRFNSYENDSGRLLEDIAEERKANTTLDSFDEIVINNRQYLVDWEDYFFITISEDSLYQYNLNMNQMAGADFIDQFIKSLTTFTTSGE